MKKFVPTSFVFHLQRSLLILLAIFVSVPLSLAQTTQGEFSDVTRVHPYYVGITYLRQNNILTGYEDGTFKPEAAIKKAEVIKLIVTQLKAPLDVPFEPIFSDMTKELWYTPYVMKAHTLGFVTGNDVTGTFDGSKQVNLAEFLKLILAANQIDVSSFEGKAVAPNTSTDEWFSNYLNYALALGILPSTFEQKVDPSQVLTRGQVANMMYLLSVILKGSDTQFLLTRAQAELAQIEVYIAANQVPLAKNASELGVEFTQQALKTKPEDKAVLGTAKIARAYDLLVDAYILGIQNKKEETIQKANEVIAKATEAWQANPDTQPIAAHIKDRAREIVVQVEGVE